MDHAKHPLLVVHYYYASSLLLYQVKWSLYSQYKPWLPCRISSYRIRRSPAQHTSQLT